MTTTTEAEMEIEGVAGAIGADPEMEMEGVAGTKPTEPEMEMDGVAGMAADPEMEIELD